MFAKSGLLAAIAVASVVGASTKFEKARELYDSGRFKEAGAIFSGLSIRNPQSQIVHYYYGNCLLKTNERSRALQHFRRAAKLNPDSTTGKYSLKMVHILARTGRAASTAPRPAAGADKHLVEGEKKYNRGRFKEAIVDFDKSIRKNPCPRAFFLRGAAKNSTMDYSGAVRDLTAAITGSRGHEFTSFFYQRGLAYFHLKKFRECISDLDQVINREPDSVSAYAYRGQAKLALGDKVGAHKDSDKASKLDGGNRDARFLREKLMGR